MYDEVDSMLISVNVPKNLKNISNGRLRKVTSKKDPNLLNLENELSDYLGSSVTISHKKNGSGKITFVYKNLEQLDSIIKPLKK